MAQLHPPLDEVKRLATPLNEGEQRVLELLCQVLDDRWQIFIQPHLLNQQPDFLIAAQHHGVTVIEVKDWQSGGHRSVDGRLEVRDALGAWHHQREDPLLQAHNYRCGVADRYLTPPNSDDLFSVVRGVVALPRWPSNVASNLLQSTTSLEKKDWKWIPVVGLEAFGDQCAQSRLIYGGPGRGRGLQESVFHRFLDRLAEPEAVSEQRDPLTLSTGARNVEKNPANATIRRVKGPVGSGKTLGLAARAAHLASTGERTLVLSFNITLAHYIQDLVRRHARHIGADHRLVDCIHIHGFSADLVRRFGGSAGHAVEDDLGDDPNEMIRAAQDLYERGVQGLPKYDAVLVDEGQDFLPDWWAFLRHHVRRPDGEMVLAADATQDIYKRRSWTDEDRMLGHGFSGDWTRLTGSYRLPVDFIPVVREFADTFIEGETDIPDVPRDRSHVAAAPTKRRWINVLLDGRGALAEIAAREVLRLHEEPTSPQPPDTVFMSNNHVTGLLIATRLADSGIVTEHIFAETEEDRRRAKTRFWPGVAAMKGCTVHSFKGWESRAIVVVVDDRAGNAVELAYVALTRLKGYPESRSAFITVINSCARLFGFKERFEREIGPDEVAELAGQTQLDLP